MKVLAIAPQPFFTPRGTPFSVYYRTLVASRLGASIDLLTYGEGEDVLIPGVRTIRIPRMPFLGPVRVGPSFGKLARDVLMVPWTIALLIRGRYDVVHAHEEAIFWCRIFKPLFRFKLVYDMHSSLPQQLTNFEFTRSRLLLGLFRRLESHALRGSDAVVTISPALAEYARASMPEPERHVLIENSLFMEVPVETGNAAPRTESGSATVPPPGRPLVLYAGTFEPYQGLDLLLRSFALVRREIPDAFLVMVGGAKEQVKRYRSMVERYGLDHDVRIAGRLTQRNVRDLLKVASVATSPRLRGINTPLKIYEILASGVPLVATAIPAHTQVLQRDSCFLAEPEPEAFATALIDAMRDRERRKRVASAARMLYEREYSPLAYEDKMRRLFELLSRDSPGRSSAPGGNSQKRTRSARPA